MSRRRVASCLAAIVCTPTSFASIAFADDLTPASLQRLVIECGARRYPSLPIRPGRAALEVLWGDHHLYLGNLYAGVRQIPPNARESAVTGFLARFSPEADARMQAAEAQARDWTKARTMLRPKLFPAATVRRAPQLVTRPLAEGVAIGYAIDLGDKDLYVDQDKFAAWCRSVSAVHEAALSNLETMSKDQGVYPPRPEGAVGALAVFDTNDGYDAARILLPGLRGRLIDALGPKLMAGVPARDCFLAWSAGLPKQRDFEAEVRDLAARMPHPVSDRIFVIERSGLRLATATEL